MKPVIGIAVIAALALSGCHRGDHSSPTPSPGDTSPGMGQPPPPPVPSGQATYDCDAGKTVQASYAGDNASLVVGTQTYLVKRTPTTDGSAAYAGQGRQWVIRPSADKETGTLSNAAGQVLAQCVKRAPGAPPPTPPVAPACKSGDLALTKVSSDAGAGQRQVTYGLVNNGPAACSLKGYPTLALFDASGKPADGVTTVQTEASYFNVGGPPKDVNIAHNAKGVFYISFTGIQATDKPCVAIARLQVTPPGNTQAMEIADALNVCTGQVKLSPVRADGGTATSSAPMFY